MPIVYEQYTKQLKLLPLTLYADGRATIDVRYSFVDKNGVAIDFSCRTIQIEAEDVSLILDAPPVAGMSRRDDLSLAVYKFLVERGYIEPGVIS